MVRRHTVNYWKPSTFCLVNDMKDIRELAKAKRAEMDAIKIYRDGKKDKQDKLAKVVKKLTQAEYDALPKSLQKELKEFR